MKSNKKVIFLIENGLSIKTVTKMSPSQVNVLVEKFKKMKKEESKEQVEKKQKVQITMGPQGGPIEVKPGQTQLNLKPDPSKPGYFEVNEKELSEDTAMDYATGYNPNEEGGNLKKGNENPQDYGTDNSVDPDGNNDGIPTTEGELRERFESKAQQGLFWARCNKCSSKNCKWCKMAKEFSDSTTKKEYKTMPKKKHPEKTVKYKKKKTNEETQKFLENQILKMLEEEKRKQMKKKKSENMILKNPKKVTMFSDEAPMQLPLGKMFSIGFK